METSNLPVLQGELIDAVPARPGGGAVTTAIVPRVSVRVRLGTLADLPFIDKLQKAHSRELGFLPRMALEGKVRLGQVLVAESDGPEPALEEATKRRSDGATKGPEREDSSDSGPSSLRRFVASSLPLGYLIAADRYFKRDEVGYITQINVVPEYRRSLVAAALLQAQFDRSAYGCRLYCCWCAQDLKANEFWEAMGFVPIAFRTGSRKRGRIVRSDEGIFRSDGATERRSDEGAGAGGGAASDPSVASSLRRSVASARSVASRARIHIFWQKRIREGDEGPGATPWWYPSQTGGGELREDRLVFPIPPGVSWRDVLPVVLPDDGGHEGTRGGSASAEARRHEGTEESIGVAPSGLAAGNRIESSDGAASGPSGPSVPSSLRASVPSAIAPNQLSGLRFAPPAPVKKVKTPRPKLRTIKRPRGPAAPGGLWFAHDIIEVLEREVEGKWVEVGQVGSPAAAAFVKELEESKRAAEEATAAAKAAKEARRPKIDPRLVEMARELRDRWSEQVQAGRFLPEATARYDVRRMIEEEPAQPAQRALPAAA